MPDAEPFLDWLTSYRSAFHDLYFITQRCGLTAKAQTERWLFLKTGLPCPTVLLSDHKGLIAAGLRLDVFIDDRPENCTNVNVYSPTTRVYMPWRDYNALADTREIRVVSTPMDMLHQEKL